MPIYGHMDDLMTRAVQYLADNLALSRRQQGLTQQQLAQLSDIPRSTITNLESGVGNPSLKTLLGVAGALKITIEELLAKPRPECLLIPYAKIPTQSRGHGGVIVRQLLPDPLKGLQIERLDLAPQGMMKGIPHAPATKEYFTCIQGIVNVIVAGENYVVNQGDVLAFPGDQRHAYHNNTHEQAAGISVITLVLPGM